MNKIINLKRSMILSFCLIITLVLAFGMAGNCFADSDSTRGSNNSNSSGNNSGYTYKVMIYSGQQGHFEGSGTDSTGTVWSGEYYSGDLLEVNPTSLGFVLDNDKYYVRGFRLAGHDNDETTGAQNLTFGVTEDVSYEIAYGIKGTMVSYTVHYVDSDGNTLMGDDVYYGMPGDKPVVAYRYIEGYEPDVYYQGQTLRENSDDNQFTFTYSRVETNTEVVTIRTGGNGNNGANGNDGVNGGNNAAQGGQNAPAAPGTIQNPTGTDAANTPGGTTIGDNDTPTTNGPGSGDNGTSDDDNGKNDTPTYIDNDPETPTSNWDNITSSPAVMAALIAVIALLIALIIWLLGKKKKNNDENQEGNADSKDGNGDK